MTTIFLPNPNLTNDMQYIKRPDWSRPSLHYRLREQFLNESLPENLDSSEEFMGEFRLR